MRVCPSKSYIEALKFQVDPVEQLSELLEYSYPLQIDIAESLKWPNYYLCEI